MSTLGQRLKELRRAKGMTQRRLAEATGLDFTYLSKIENGRLSYTPSARALRQLAAALEADELELLQLAQKVPESLGAIAQDQDAVRFFRRAREVVKSPEAWESLLRYLEQGREGEPSDGAGDGNTA
jgi:transcriptional regulator with XRE-family HTH domain